MLRVSTILLCLGLTLAHDFRRVIGEDKPKIPGYLSSSGFINVGPANISIFVINNADKKEGNNRPKPFNNEDLALENLFNPFERDSSGRASNDLETKSHNSLFGNILADEMMNTLNDPGFLSFTNKILSSLLPPPRPSNTNGHHHRHIHRPLLSPPAPGSRSAKDNPQVLNSVVKLLSQDLGGLVPKKQPGPDGLMMFEIIGMPEKVNFGKDHPFQNVFPSLNVSKPVRIYTDLKSNLDSAVDKSENIVPETITSDAGRKVPQNNLKELKPKPERVEKQDVTIRTVKKDTADGDIVTNEINTEDSINTIPKSTVEPDMEIPIVKPARPAAERSTT